MLARRGAQFVISKKTLGNRKSVSLHFIWRCLSSNQAFAIHLLVHVIAEEFVPGLFRYIEYGNASVSESNIIGFFMHFCIFR